MGRNKGGTPGRQPLGKAGRTITKTVKVTEYELEYLTRAYGSGSSGLRAALDKMLPASVNHPGRPPKAHNVLSEQDTLEDTVASCGPNISDHPGWKILARGKTTVHKACRACGKRVSEKE